jgi:hypothetical protein
MWKGIFAGDNHAGSLWGLMSPDRVSGFPDEVQRMHNAGWKWWVDELAEIGPVDDLIFTGDGIEGPGVKDALDIAFNDLGLQCEIGAETFEPVKRKHTYGVRGTPVHVAKGGKDWEDEMFDYMHGNLSDEQRLEVYGFKFHIRHHVGNSQTPYGHASQVRKEAANDLIKGALEKYPWANFLARGHVHQYSSAGTPGQFAFSCPCLKFPYDKFGRKLQTLNYHFGFVYMEIEKNGRWWCEPKVMPMQATKAVSYVRLK